MPIRQRERWLALDSRTREKGDYEESTLAIAGAMRRERPKAPDNVSISGRPGYVDISWQPVLENESGKPLESLARYVVYYKWGSGSIPDIDPRTPTTYDDAVIVDNTRLSLPVHSGSENTIKTTVTCRDRWGRESGTSVQEQATVPFTKTATVIDWGAIVSYGDDIEKTVVRSWPLLAVPEGYRYVVTVWPMQGIVDSGAHSDSDLLRYSIVYTYGYFWYDGADPEHVAPHLLPGTYNDVTLEVYHSGLSSSMATCWDEAGESIVPHYSFDYEQNGLLRLGSYLIEAVYSAGPQEKSQWKFLPVLWMLWLVPI